MTTDIKLTDERVIVEGPLQVSDAVEGGLKIKGNVGIGVDTPGRPLHVVGWEIHSGGDGGGFSFGDRKLGAELVNSPSKGERYVWYADGGTAKLWSGSDLFSIGADGKAGFAADLAVAANLSVAGDVASEGNVAVAGKVQIDGELNVGPGQSGITIGEGKIWVTTINHLRIGGKNLPQIGRTDLVEMVTDLKAEVQGLKKELEELRAKVG